MLTADVTDLKGSDWRLLRRTKGVQILDLLGRNDHIELIMETTKNVIQSDADWGRDCFLQVWKEDLRTGDVVDAMDKLSNWFEAIVMGVAGNGDITVHFKGWSSEFDEVIRHAQRDRRIQPLYTRTIDWRSGLEEDDKVEIKISPPGTKIVWLPVTVAEVDRPNQRVQVVWLFGIAVVIIVTTFSSIPFVILEVKSYKTSTSQPINSGTKDNMRLPSSY
jgi:hypothetical protein